MPGPDFFNYFSDAGSEASPPSLLQGASVTDWSMLIDYGVRRSFRAGDAVLSIGETSRSLLIVLSGSLQVSGPSSGPWRRRTVLDHVGPGSVVGEVAFFDGGERSTDVVAYEDSEVFLLEWHSFERLAAVRPRVAVSLLADLGRVVAQRFRATAARDG